MNNSKDRPHPKANPQYWANNEHLNKAHAAGGEEGSVEAFKKLQNELPPIEKRHRAQAAAYNRWNGANDQTEKPKGKVAVEGHTVRASKSEAEAKALGSVGKR